MDDTRRLAREAYALGEKFRGRRSDEDILSGVLRIAVGGVEKEVPTLSIRATREWQASLAADEASAVSDADLTPADTSRVLDLSLTEILNIVVTYDRTAALGGREWLEEHADPAQLYEAANQMAEVAFPFARDTRMLLRALLARSVAASSTNGPSPSGGSTPAPSKTASTRAS
jgi:hypothetical protein